MSSRTGHQTTKSYSKRSLLDREVITGGVKRTKRQEDRRRKISKKANFDYLEKLEQEKE